MIKLIIIDRDGVINHDSPDFIKSPEEWVPIDGSLKAITKLTKAGFTIAVATNQSGVGRKLYSLETLEQIHQKMRSTIEKAGGKVDHVFYCPHLPQDNCLCRKPKPGLFKEIAKYYGIDYHLQKVPAIGDSLRDLEAAQTAGAYPILVETGNGRKTKVLLPERFKNIECFSNLVTAVDALISSQASDH